MATDNYVLWKERELSLPPGRINAAVLRLPVCVRVLPTKNLALNPPSYTPRRKNSTAPRQEAGIVNPITGMDAMGLMHEQVKNLHECDAVPNMPLTCRLKRPSWSLDRQATD